MSQPRRRDDRLHTYADYLTWPDRPRYELIDGVAYEMQAAPSLDHQRIAGAIYAQIYVALLGRRCQAFIAPVDVRLPKPGQDTPETDTVVQPDVLVVCDPAKLDRRGVRGAPDWVVEVLSPSTAGHDQIRKRRAYEQAGVREYWLVHPADRIVRICRLTAGRYPEDDVRDLEGETAVGVLDGVTVQWETVVAGLAVED